MKKGIKIGITIVVSILFLVLCGFAVFGNLTELQVKHGEFGGIALCIGATLLFALLNLLLFAPNVGLFFLTKGEDASRIRNIICLVLTIIFYPLILLLIKPATVTVGQFLSMKIAYGTWYQSGLVLFNLSEAHFYPALKIFIGDFNCGWLLGFVLLIVFVLVITAINGAKDRFNEQYNYDLAHVEHKEHLEITDTITYSGIFNPKEHHDIKTKVVDDTEYPVHDAIWTCLLLALGVILTPYITFLTLITRQIISIVKK
ncbi:MAG: hypothetical protein E7349_02640 [Clostridiales bacterium]|nr:hypothetical protein [Clostridiales bacterium]